MNLKATYLFSNWHVNCLTVSSASLPSSGFRVTKPPRKIIRIRLGQSGRFTSPTKDRDLLVAGKRNGTGDLSTQEREGLGLDAARSIRQTVEQVQQFSLFRGLSPSDCASIVAAAQKKNFMRRQTIFFEGSPIRQILLLVSGCVKVSQFGQSGTEVILRLSGPGDVIGSLALLSQKAHCSTAQTLAASTVLVWESANFDSVLNRFPILWHNIARILEDRLNDMDQRFREISTEKVALRLSSELVRLMHQVGQRVNDHVEISLSREEMAQLTGTTLFTVSRLLCQWEVLGIVSVRRGGVLVRDLPALVALSQDQQ
jgi:CRP-like cAMP-binding protein